MLRRLTIALAVVALGIVPAIARGANSPSTQNESTTDKAKGIARNAGQQVSDSWITLKTKVDLLADSKVSSNDVHVTTQKGVITLRGKVQSEEAKQAAEDDAAKVSGAKKVVNHLAVVPKAVRLTIARKDDQITKDVEARLKKDPNLKQAKIDVHSDNGIVTLTGDAPTLRTSERASEVAHRVAGVRAVHNELSIESQGAQG